MNKALAFIDFFQSTGTDIHLVYVSSTFIKCWIYHSNDRYEHIGIAIKSYLDNKDDPRPDFSEMYRQLLLERLTEYFGGAEAITKFESLKLDVDLVKGNEDRPVIKMFLYMPDYESEKDNYIKAIKTRYKTLYGKDISIVADINMT